jgi:hypothetical protein
MDLVNSQFDKPLYYHFSFEREQLIFCLFWYQVILSTCHFVNLPFCQLAQNGFL